MRLAACFVASDGAAGVGGGGGTPPSSTHMGSRLAASYSRRDPSFQAASLAHSRGERLYLSSTVGDAPCVTMAVVRGCGVGGAKAR